VHLLNAVRELPRIHMRSSKFLSDPGPATDILYNTLTQAGVRGLHMPTLREITAFVDPKLHRAKAEDAKETLTLTPHQRTLEAMLAGDAPLVADTAVSEDSLAALRSLTPAA
jgi:hypothetical protein